ncbi:MAG: succinate dehydrogenase cytochrome b subunit [Flavobacteriales bacterium]|nr:succinate dehydrogenase cytochrome b subunit [Flavobacteriales bacterium]
MKSSIARKLAMALSALFLMFFLLQHLTINSLSLVSEEMFNEVSHFMGTNPLVQFLLQPILIFAVVFHFIMGFVLEWKNNAARGVKYAMFNGGASSTWMSRNMIWTGLAILGFIGLHFYDFWIPEMNIKYVQGDMSGLLDPANQESGQRYYEELRHKFVDIWRVILYVVSFVFLALHLNHGFQSSFQSVGFNNRYTPLVRKIGTAYSILIPLGFIFIAVFHYITH